MHNLVIDIGNTKSKISVFIEKELLYYQAVQEPEIQFVQDLISEFNINHSIVSNVADTHPALTNLLREKTNYIEFSTSKNTGILNHYKTAATLGLDRWANVIAAHQLFPGQNCFIIDAGTCITYDLLNGKGEYFGGSISPGINMRFSALNHYTGRLPMVAWNAEADIPEGRDTNSAIQSGVLQGVINEIQGFIAIENNKNIELQVLITGGDAGFLWKQLKNSIFAPQIIHDPYLVLKGLNEVIAFEYV
ncbi:MAG: pantothenate kinase [Pedobacter sp.]|jgi:type III pantothenate kinase|nr:pantothenate kinase [Pedobacter sp.]